ncbi:hypothetical protein SAMN05444166_4105 [Singulisphaera sp. GP187]|nr:hypothetical protein SAMN05444166_4105 [Singulisphaera sp. GP187]
MYVCSLTVQRIIGNSRDGIVPFSHETVKNRVILKEMQEWLDVANTSRFQFSKEPKASFFWNYSLDPQITCFQ